MMRPFHVHYRVYPNAPKATRKSIRLGTMTSWFFLLAGCMIVHLAVGYLLYDGLDFSGIVSNLSGLAAGGFFLRKILRLKKRLIARLDCEAAWEAAEG